MYTLPPTHSLSPNPKVQHCALKSWSLQTSTPRTPNKASTKLFFMITSPRCRPKNQQGHKFRVQMVQSDLHQFETGPILQQLCSTITNVAAKVIFWAATTESVLAPNTSWREKHSYHVWGGFSPKYLLLRNQTGTEILISLNYLHTFSTNDWFTG